LDRAGGEEAHEVVLEGQVEAAGARIALAAGAAAELVVDAAALVPLRAEHVQTAELADPVALGLAGGRVLLEQLGQALLALFGVGLEPFGEEVAHGEALGVAAEE